MQFRSLALAPLAVSMALRAAAAQASPDVQTLKYSVTRDDMPIGTNTIDVEHKGPETTVQIETHVAVGFASITFYKFDQTESERWANGHLLAMKAVTDDNGTVHRTNADNRGGKLVVDGDGQIEQIAPTIVPASLWNSALLTQSVALNLEDGKVVPVSVVDRGEDNVTITGRSARAHHYVITAGFSQDVWYDEAHRLVKMELKGADGSTIRYELI